MNLPSMIFPPMHFAKADYLCGSSSQTFFDDSIDLYKGPNLHPAGKVESYGNIGKPGKPGRPKKHRKKKA
jgi:hypothetical protein